MLVEQTVRGLSSRGHEVRLLTADEIVRHRRTPLSYVDSRRCRQAVRRELADFQPEIVHIHNLYHELSPGILETLGRWKQRRGGRVVMTAHDFHLICPNSGLRWFRDGDSHRADPDRLGQLRYLVTHRWDHRSLAHASLKLIQHLWNYRLNLRHRVLDSVICPSRFLGALLARHGLPTVVVPNPAPTLPRVSVDRDDAMRLVFAGRLEPEKGIAQFIEALPPKYPATLTVIGDGSEADACRQAVDARATPPVIEFTGRLPHHETIEHIRKAHGLVLPSRVDENAPIVLLEALASGTSILTSDRGGMREIVESAGTGYLYDPENRQSIADALDRALDDHRAGTLNTFDVGDFLDERSEDRYFESLMAVYMDAPSVEPEVCIA